MRFPNCLFAIPVLWIIFLNEQFLFAQEKWCFKPLLSNPYEARIGSMYQFSNRKLRLDIGNTFELFNVVNRDSFNANIGVDFFTLTLLRAEGNFKFPVETTDFFFGVNSTFYLKKSNNYNYSFRIRIAHISSHLSDGLSINSIFTREPFTYSREFFETIVCFEIEKFRIYFGGNYVFSALPKDVVKLIPQLGFDYEVELRKWLKFLVGNDTKLTGYNNSYYLTWSFQATFLLHQLMNKGVGINLNYFEGKSIYGMFYKEKDSYFAIGFQLFFY